MDVEAPADDERSSHRTRPTHGEPSSPEQNLPLLNALRKRSALHGPAAPRDWRQQVDDAWWYRVSCFSYCVAGSLAAVRPEPLARYGAPCCPSFPFRAMGIAITLNGFASYMGDVVTLAQESYWKHIDVLLATINSVVQICIATLSLAGEMSFPAQAGWTLSASIIVALYCKRRSVLATRDRDCDAYLRWHAAWHYTLPAGAIAAQLML